MKEAQERKGLADDRLVVDDGREKSPAGPARRTMLRHPASLVVQPRPKAQ